MKTINPEYIERVNQLINRCPYFELLSMKISEVGAGFSVMEIDLAQKHLQPFGFVHGGGYMLKFASTCKVPPWREGFGKNQFDSIPI